MKTRKLLAMMLALLVILISGCGKEAEVIIQEEPKPLTDMEITDPIELAEIWDGYLYFAITTIMNTETYNSPADIDPNDIIQYCWDQYLADNGKEALIATLEPVSEESNSLYFPMETAMDYVEKYFNTRELDLSLMQEEYYDVNKGAFTFPAYGRRILSYRDENAWGIELEQAIRHTDGSITATLAQNANGRNELVEREFICTLIPRDDGSYYISRGTWQYLDIDTVAIQGDHLDLGPLETGYKRIIGETADWVIMSTNDEERPLLALDKGTLEVVRALSADGAEYTRPGTVKDEDIILYLEGRIEIYNSELRFEEEIGLPSSLLRTEGEDEVFGRDLSPDRKNVIYSDKEGLKLYNLESGSSSLLMGTLPGRGQPPDGIRNRYFYHPRFVAGGYKVVATLAGYDYNTGFISYELETGTFQLVEEYFEGISTKNQFYDSGMLAWIEAHREGEAGEAEIPTDYGLFDVYYYDFASGQTNIIEAELAETSVDYIRWPDSVYNGKNQVAFLTFTDNMKVIHINRLNLDTWKLEEDIVNVEGANVYILGVLEDGSILFSYYRNSAENGLCLIR